MSNYSLAKERYAAIGVDTDAAINALLNIPISLQCWQGDDVRGFIFKDSLLSGGILSTGNYPYRARNASELRRDIDAALALIGGKHRVNLHSIYADTDEQIDLCDIEPRHYASWVEWANERDLGLDFNPTCFSHPRSASGFTISSPDKSVRDFWIEHCKRSRQIGEYFGKQTGKGCVTNLWFPDGSKDTPFDKYAPRMRAMESLEEIISREIDAQYNLDALESKLFGIGAESYTVCSNEFCIGFAQKHSMALCLDSGHFHPTEVISDKISAALLFVPRLLLHVSRPVRWDSDHVVTLNDELLEIARALISNVLINRVSIGLDYFDGSINRVAAWVIGMRNTQKALLYALLEPAEALSLCDTSADYTRRLVLFEEQKTMPFSLVWDRFCEQCSVPTENWYKSVLEYEEKELSKR